MNIIKKYITEILCSSLILGLGMLSGAMTKVSDYQWYAELKKPFFTPPSWVFGPIWTILYIMLGIVCAQLIKNKNYKTLFVFIIHLFANLIWTFLFFTLHRVDIACADIGFMLITLMLLFFLIKKAKLTNLLLIPYSLWISLAAILNTVIFYMN